MFLPQQQQHPIHMNIIKGKFIVSRVTSPESYRRQVVYLLSVSFLILHYILIYQYDGHRRSWLVTMAMRIVDFEEDGREIIIKETFIHGLELH